MRSSNHPSGSSDRGTVVGGPIFAAAIPPTLVGAYLLAGEAALTATAAVATAAAAASCLRGRGHGPMSVDPETGLPSRDDAIRRLDAILARPSWTGRRGAVVTVRIGRRENARGLGAEANGFVLLATIGRIADALRDGDQVFRIGEGTFAVILGRSAKLGTAGIGELAARVSSLLAQPLRIDGNQILLEPVIGACLERDAPGNDGAAYLSAAEAALESATAKGGFALYERDDASSDKPPFDAQLRRAVEEGVLLPWLQPRVDQTGKAVGLDATMWWYEPELGMLTAETLFPALGQMSLEPAFLDAMLDQVARAAKDAPASAADVPRVVLPLPAELLRDPDLAEKIAWALDARELSPRLLCFQVPDRVAAACDERVARNARGLATLGCEIEIGDFGSGQTPAAFLGRLGASRIRIAGSLIRHCDTDADKRRVLRATITMAHALGMSAAAAEVGTEAERRVLAELGCDTVQGPTVANPMPAGEAIAWAAERLPAADPAEVSSRSA